MYKDKIKISNRSDHKFNYILNIGVFTEMHARGGQDMRKEKVLL
jgi:hypothetical protein